MGVKKDARTMKLLSLFLVVTVVTARSPIRPTQQPFRYIHKFRPSWYIDNNVKDAAGCNSSWSSAATVQTLQTDDHRIFIDTARHGGTTGDSRNVCVYIPSHEKMTLGVDDCNGTCAMGEVVPGKWILATGTVGACGQGCCEWNSPEYNMIYRKILPSHHPMSPRWYETTTDCEGERPDLIFGPQLMKGLEGQRKSICMETCDYGEEGCGKFWQAKGNLQFCTSHCCKLDGHRWIGPPPIKLIKLNQLN